MSGFSSFINKFNIVKQIPIFSKLNWLEMQRVARYADIVEYRKGANIREAGDPPDAFYCLVSGRVQAYTLNERKKKENVEFLHRGMHFGIISLLTGENHSLNFTALNDSVVLQINKDSFNKILKSIPHLGIELSQSLSKRIRSKVTKQKLIFESNIISVYSPVEGVGSSTYAINLALHLQKETHKKVILLNINSRSATSRRSIDTDVNEAAPQWKEGAQLIQDLIGDHQKILDSITKDELPIDFLNAIFDLGDTALTSRISEFVSAFVNDYHYVIVDLPNNMDNLVIKTLTQSDLIHLVVMDREKDLELARLVIDRLEETLDANFKEEKIQVILGGVGDERLLTDKQVRKVLNYPISAKLPHIKRSELNAAVVTKGLTVITSDDDSEYTKMLRRIARKIGGVLVGIVLGGGAALGIAHIGVIRVLEEEGIDVDFIIGSSMGALVGSMWSMGKNSDELEVIAREFEKKLNLVKLFDPPLFPISGLIRGKKIVRWLKGKLGDSTFEDTEIPFKAISYDLMQREEIVIDRGTLVSAVRESIAIPGVIPPITRHKRMIIDGGVLNPLPTNILVSMGIKKIIAVNVLQSPEQVVQGFQAEQRELERKARVPFYKRPISWMAFRIGRLFGKGLNPNIADIIVRTLQSSEYVIAEQSAQHADVVLHPDLAGIQWFELYRVDELIKAGENVTRQHLAEIKAMVSEN